VRNDARVIAAARAVFSEQGPQASMETIATRAGLGVGTIYRRFAGKEELLDAIARMIGEEMEEAAAAAAAAPDPSAGLEQFLEFVGTFNAERRRYAAVLADRVRDDRTSERTAESVRRLTESAVAAGALAPHVSAEDIKSLVIAIRGVVAAGPEGDDRGWRRFVRIHLAGLRAD
jgi:AcrR family transcriptional regulator